MGSPQKQPVPIVGVEASTACNGTDPYPVLGLILPQFRT